MMGGTETRAGVAAVLGELAAASAAKQCHACGCFRGALTQFGAALPSLAEQDRTRLQPALAAGEARLEPARYDCLGCAVCWPANALNLAAVAFPASDIGAEAVCPADLPPRAEGWPPYPGNHRVLDAAGDVAVCVLTSEPLMEALAAARPPRVAIVGALFTENLGIERLVTNVLASPNLTTLLVCGADSRQRIGHLPGQSLMRLVTHGTDGRRRIVGAEGRRPVLRNLAPESIAAFRAGIAVVDRIGEEDPLRILEALAGLPAQRPRHAARLDRRPAPLPTRPPGPLVLDPHGYFVLFPDHVGRRILIEHYDNRGTLEHLFEGRGSVALCATLLAHGLVSRLDHAAYLGRELALAERALRTGEPYVQDRAPEADGGDGGGCSPPARRTEDIEP